MTQDRVLKLIAQVKAEGGQELDLAGISLEERPAEIGELTHLEKLLLGKEEANARGTTRIRGNRLIRLPPKIVQLTSLQSLDLGGNQLSEFTVGNSPADGRRCGGASCLDPTWRSMEARSSVARNSNRNDLYDFSANGLDSKVSHSYQLAI